MKKENKNDIAGIIYLAENKENHKKYIGASTKSLELRKQDHLQKANKGVGHNFQHAIQTYGADAFSWTSIDTASGYEELARKEKYYIKKYDSFRNGYNGNKGAGFQKPVYQYNLTRELINKFDSLQEACKYLQVDKRCLSKVCLSVNHSFNGCLWSYDLQNPFEPKRDLRRTEVIQLNSNNELLATFKSIADASRKTGIHKSSIAKCCRGERRTAGGFIFNNKRNKMKLNKEDEITSPSSITTTSNTTSPCSTPIIYVTNEKEVGETEEKVVFKGVLEGIEVDIDTDIYAQFAPFSVSDNEIQIPKKVKYALTKYASRKKLKAIHKDLEVAIEMCLIIISNLSSTYFDRKWKSLHSTVLNDQVKWKSDNTWNYRPILDLLLEGTRKKGPFIDVKTNEEGKESYRANEYSKSYWIADFYCKAGLENYKIRNKWLIENRRRHVKNVIESYSKNVIAKNLIKVYPRITFPTPEHLMKVGKELAKEGAVNNKGKRITMRNKHSDSHWNNPKERSFVEDNIDRYSELMKNGPKIYSIGSVKSGGRVVDTFTLMTSWIRKECKIDGEEISFLDFKCLHPNNAMKKYGGTGQRITHELVAEYLGVDRQKAKDEHLIFFNIKNYIMRKMKLWKFYFEREPEMLANLIEDKSRHGHKVASQKLLKEEVELMGEVICILNEKGIYPGYVYDALFCNPKEEDTALEVMNQVAKRRNINTVATFQ